MALLCALAPLGPPSSQLTGSAFNPATASVGIKARSPATPQAKRQVGPDGAGIVPPPFFTSLPLMPRIAIPVVPYWHVGPADSPWPREVQSLAGAAPARRPPARAPPIS